MANLTKRDGNHKAIRDALLAAGCSVVDASSLGGGFPDLVVGVDGWNRGGNRTYLLEVKAPKARGRSQGELSPTQKAWHAEWRGHVAVVRTVDEALQACGLTPPMETR